jgi:PAP2 superfamily
MSARTALPSFRHTAAFGFAGAVASVWSAARAACGVSAAVVAAERMHSGAHYPSDVAAGAVIGLAVAALIRTTPSAVATGAVTGGDAWPTGYAGSRPDGKRTGEDS